MSDQTEPTRPRLTDLEWARRVVFSLDDAAPDGGFGPDAESNIPTGWLHSLRQTVVDQAAEIERLTPCVLTGAAEIEGLPNSTVVRDREGDVFQRRGEHWVTIEDESTWWWSRELLTPVDVIFIPKGVER